MVGSKFADASGGFVAVVGDVRGENDVRVLQDLVVTNEAPDFLETRGGQASGFFARDPDALEDLLTQNFRSAGVENTLVLEDIQAEASDLPGLESLLDGPELDESASSSVEQENASFALREGLGVDEVAGFGVQGQVEADDIGFRENFLQAGILKVEQLGVEGLRV